MFVERTFRHKKRTGPGEGEFIELTFRIVVDEAPKSDTFEIWSTDHRLFKDQIELMKQGALSAISGHELGSLKVALIEHRWSDVDTPDWLFEYGAKTCVGEALQELQVRIGSVN